MILQASRVSLRVAAVTAALVVVLSAGLPGRARAQASNLDLLRSLTRDVAGDILDDLGEASAGRPIRLKAIGTTEEYRLIENVFTAAMSQRGMEVYRAAQGVEPPDGVLDLEYQAVQFGVEYPRVFRSYLVGGKQVRRNAVVRISATLVDPSTGGVVDVAEATREASDTFSRGDLDMVQQGKYEFVSPPMPSSGWGRVVEPVLVSGIIVGLIYLFFSNQSDA